MQDSAQAALRLCPGCFIVLSGGRHAAEGYIAVGREIHKWC
jgi:hypothetical protein